jgi:hypothetical protein
MYWLQTGEWYPINFQTAWDWSGIRLKRVDWIGLQQLMDWVGRFLLDLPLWLVIVGVGGMMRYAERDYSEREPPPQTPAQRAKEVWYPGMDMARVTDEPCRKELEKLSAAFAALPREQQEEQVRRTADEVWYDKHEWSKGPLWDDYVSPLREELEKRSAAAMEKRREEQREFIRAHWIPGEWQPEKHSYLEDYIREEYERLDAAFKALPLEPREEQVRQIAKRLWHPNMHTDHYFYAPLRREFEKLNAEHNRKYMILAPPNQQKSSGP